MLEDRTLADLLTAVLDAPDVDELLEGALPVLHGVTALELVEPGEDEAVVRGRAGRPNGVAAAQALPGVPERLTVWSTDPDGPGAVPDPVLAVLAMVRRRRVMRTPTALWMALATAAGGGTIGTSPAPRMPNG